MSNKKRKKGNGQNGLDNEALQGLRATMREAVKQHGEDRVLPALNASSMDDALGAVHSDMLRADFGRMSNALKKLEPPKVHSNKYAHLVPEG